jgi:nickel-dependent lactate racemase
VLGTHAPRPTAPLDDVTRGLDEALASPIGVAPFGDGALAGKKIAIVVDDVSRPTPVARFLPGVLAHLIARGARREHMRVLLALGVHRPMTQAEVDAKLGAGAYDGIPWHNHDADDPRALAPLGTTSRGTRVSLNRHLTEVDLIVCLGAIEPHLLLGFGGGLKMLVPGLAAKETIAQNHMQGVSPRHFNYVGEDESPMRLDLEEAAGMLGKPIFVVNAVMNDRLELCRFVAGDPVAAHREGVRAVRAIARCPVREQADVVIVASNPMNADLRQGMKCVGHVQASVKEGGLVIALLGCRNGVGDLKIPARTLPHVALRGLLRVLGRERVLGFVDRVQKGAGVEERFLAHFSLQSVRRNELFVWSPRLPAETGKRMGIFAQFATPAALLRRAAKIAPRRATVHVFPYGGMTYAAPGA